ncbi:MAG: DNA recombination protein RmuC [Nitratireductor sp.]|nr:DNA recombination protein RmuC [Nitratireductor sp.]
MNSDLDLSALFASPVFTAAGRVITLGECVAAAVAALGLILLLWLVLAWRAGKRRAANEAAALERAREAEARMSELVATQNELTGRLAAMNENLAQRQSDLARSVSERLEAMTGRIGQSITDTTRNTQESLARLQERLAVIDTAQTNITALTGQVVELQAILANKQTRGAFGEARMQAILQDGLPQGAYAFQATLSNGSRPDAIIHMPNDTPPLVIDAKFPLESWNAIRDAETTERAKIAGQAFRRDVEAHIKAIAEKYFIKGETQDTAFLFVPSESIFADIHEKHETLVQRAHRARIVIVSPSLLMLSIQVIQSVLKDHRMREQAHLIQGEVARLVEDVGRLDERVRKLAGHFGQAQKDVDDILISSGKVAKRSTRIVDLEFEEARPLEGDKRRGLKVVE